MKASDFLVPLCLVIAQYRPAQSSQVGTGMVSPPRRPIAGYNLWHLAMEMHARGRNYSSHGGALDLPAEGSLWMVMYILPMDVYG